MNTTIVLNKFKEGTINFLPTYKYDRGTHNYDTSRKQRVPAWTDRILFKSSSDKIKLLEYNSVQGVTFTDHRPVNALFQIFTKSRIATQTSDMLESEYY